MRCDEYASSIVLANQQDTGLQNSTMRAIIAIVVFLFGINACATPITPSPPTPTLQPFVVDYSAIPRATPRPVTPVPTITPGGSTTASFSQDILPILQQNCIGCHGGIAGMWLTDYDRVRLPSNNGATLFPGDPDRSPLYLYLRDGLMPANANRLSPDQIALIRQWILEGAFNN